MCTREHEFSTATIQERVDAVTIQFHEQENILNVTEKKNSRNSTIRIAAMLNISQTRIIRILKSN